MQAFSKQRKQISPKSTHSNFSDVIVTWREATCSGAPTYIEVPNMRHSNLIILEIACFYASAVVVVIIVYLFTDLFCF